MKPGSLRDRAWHATVDHNRDRAFWWRPYCWARGYHTPQASNAWWEVCDTCDRLLWEQADDETRPQWLNVWRTPTTWRRWLRVPA